MLDDGTITHLHSETRDILPHIPQTPFIHPLDLWLGFTKPTNKEAFAEFPFLPTGQCSGANCQVTWLANRTRHYLALPTLAQEDQQLLALTSLLDFLISMPALEDERAGAGRTQNQCPKFLPPQILGH